MKAKNHQQKICIYVFGVLLLFLGLLVVWEQLGNARETESGKRDITVSHKSGFYSEAFVLKLSGKNIDTIYYTMDGSQPEAGGENTLVYDGGIRIGCEEEETVWQIGYLVRFQDGSLSEPANVTYITGTRIAERYDMDVLTVWGVPDGLFGYENGVFVQGKLGEEYIAETIAEHPDYQWGFDNHRFPVFGNRYLTGREAERSVAMTLFDRSGHVLLSQNCGLRIYGAMSRSKNQPSFRLYARSEYDEENTFHYPLFEDRYTYDGKLMDQYKRLIVRNGGNDNGYAYIRNEFAQRICQEAGFLDTQSVRPVCVYVNGAYYGTYWILSNYDDRYFEETYGEYTGQMYVYEGIMEELDTSQEEEEPIYYELAEEYNEKQQYFSRADLSLEENWAELNEFMDVENFLQYMAIQNYIGNTDTLYNNFRIYRYYASDGEYLEDSVFDGRFRFLLFDLDYSLGLLQVDDSGTLPTASTLSDRLSAGWDSILLLAKLLERQDCREYYLRYSLSLMNYYFSEAHAMPVLWEMHGSREKELRRVYETELPADNFLAPAEVDYANVEKSPDSIRWYLSERPKYALEDWEESFGELDTCKVILTNESEATVTLDYASLHEKEFEGTYIRGLSVNLSAVPRKGRQFVKWIVNGTTFTSQEIEITPEMLSGEELRLECVCEPDPEADLEITAVKPKGGADYIVITNFSQESRRLSDYFLSDDGENIMKSSLPGLELGAGESVTVYCRNYTGAEALGNPGVDFNIKVGEIVTLSHKSGRICSQLTVPELGTKYGVYTMDPYTGEFGESL